MLFSTTAGSADESGLRQCSEFITECMGSCALRDAARISSAAAGSGMVGHSIASNPASRAIWKRSSTGIFPGSMREFDGPANRQSARARQRPESGSERRGGQNLTAGNPRHASIVYPLRASLV